MPNLSGNKKKLTNNITKVIGATAKNASPTALAFLNFFIFHTLPYYPYLLPIFSVTISFVIYRGGSKSAVSLAVLTMGGVSR